MVGRADSAAPVVLDPGSDEEREWRGQWMTLMFGWTLGYNRDPGSYAAWLAAKGVHLG